MPPPATRSPAALALPDSFVAIDFELANPRRSSPIQVGVTRVLDGRVGRAHMSAITPPAGHDEFDWRTQRVHGLTPADIAGAPEWATVLARIDRFTTPGGGRRLPLVAHNASVERSVIVQTSAAVRIQAPEFEYIDTVKLARQLDPAAPNHKLDTLAERYGLGVFLHHDAGADAAVTALLLLHLASIARTAHGGDMHHRPSARPPHRTAGSHT